MKISINFEIPDFDKHEIEIQCTVCRLHNWVKLGEIRRRDFTICRGCHYNILLVDHLGKYQKFIRSLEKTFNNIF